MDTQERQARARIRDNIFLGKAFIIMGLFSVSLGAFKFYQFATETTRPDYYIPVYTVIIGTFLLVLGIYWIKRFAQLETK